MVAVRTISGRGGPSIAVRLKVAFSIHERDYALPIQMAHQRASQVLLDLLIREHGLVQHFTTLKRYFFHEKGDVILQFVDVAEEVGDSCAGPHASTWRPAHSARSQLKGRTPLPQLGCRPWVASQDLRKEGVTIVWPRVQSLLDIAIRTRCEGWPYTRCERLSN